MTCPIVFARKLSSVNSKDYVTTNIVLAYPHSWSWQAMQDFASKSKPNSSSTTTTASYIWQLKIISKWNSIACFPWYKVSQFYTHHLSSSTAGWLRRGHGFEEGSVTRLTSVTSIRSTADRLWSSAFEIQGGFFFWGGDLRNFSYNPPPTAYLFDKSGKLFQPPTMYCIYN